MLQLKKKKRNWQIQKRERNNKKIGKCAFDDLLNGRRVLTGVSIIDIIYMYLSAAMRWAESTAFDLLTSRGGRGRG